MEENQYGSDYFVLTDEDGKEEEFEHLATIDYEGAVYMAMTPADPENESDETEIVIFKVEEDEESGEARLTAGISLFFHKGGVPLCVKKTEDNARSTSALPRRWRFSWRSWPSRCL